MSGGIRYHLNFEALRNLNVAPKKRARLMRRCTASGLPRQMKAYGDTSALVLGEIRGGGAKRHRSPRRAVRK